MKTDCETDGSSAAIVKREEISLLGMTDELHSSGPCWLLFSICPEWENWPYASQPLNIWTYSIFDVVWSCKEWERSAGSLEECRAQVRGIISIVCMCHINSDSAGKIEVRFSWQCSKQCSSNISNDVSMNTIRKETCTFDLIWKLSVEAWRAVLCASE